MLLRKDVLSKDQQIQDKDQQIQDKDQQIQDKDQQIQDKDQRIQDKDQQIRDKDQDLQHVQQQIEAMRREMQSKDQQLQITQQLFEQQLQEKDRSLQRSQQQVQDLRSSLSQLSTEPWVISREELTLTEELLGSGAYGEVRVAMFRGMKVAAKVLHKVIISDYNLRIFSREMTIASQVRHPNLLLFIGAITQGHPPIIVTELLAASLRAELFQHPLSKRQIKSIAMDVAFGLNYLHQRKPHPIIHRDVSSPNVLLKPSGANSWEAKVSDYGSANSIQQITSYSIVPGNPAYAAPEARFPDDHTPKMDVYSFGVLLFEMSLQEQPEMSVAGRAKQAKMVQWDPLAQIIEVCIAHLPKDRPTIAQVSEKLRPIPL